MSIAAPASVPVPKNPAAAASPAVPAAPAEPRSSAATAGLATPSGFWTPPTPIGAVKAYFGKLTSRDEVGIVARLDAQADLSKLGDLPRGAERRVAAWEAIRATADSTQGPMRELLDGWKKTGAVNAYDGWALGNTFELTVPRGKWREVYQGLEKNGQLGLLMAFDGKGILAYQNDDAGKVERATKAMSKADENPLDKAKSQLNPKRDPAYDAGPKDPATFQFDANGNAWNAVQIGADKAWADGITGKGVRVGVMDTGVDRKHPMLRHAVGDARDAARWFDGAGKAGDPAGHGTHVAGTIAGRDPKGKRSPGIAPDAQLLVATMDDSLIGPFQWFLAPGKDAASSDAAKGADLISNSWGMEGKLAPVADVLDAPLRQLREAGTTVLFAAGNSGPGAGTINFPGANPDVITVGATRRDGTIAGFSSRAKKGQSKPDIAAPGAAVPSAVPVSNVGNMLPLARLTNIITGDAIPEQAEQKPVPGTGGAMWQMSGTSMATPTTAGAVALLLQKFPTLMPDQVKQVLQESAIDMGPKGPDGAYGAGRLDIQRAFAAATRLTGSAS